MLLMFVDAMLLICLCATNLARIYLSLFLSLTIVRIRGIQRLAD